MLVLWSSDSPFMKFWSIFTHVSLTNASRYVSHLRASFPSSNHLTFSCLCADTSLFFGPLYRQLCCQQLWMYVFLFFCDCDAGKFRCRFWEPLPLALWVDQKAGEVEDSTLWDGRKRSLCDGTRTYADWSHPHHWPQRRWRVPSKGGGLISGLCIPCERTKNHFRFCGEIFRRAVLRL